MNSKKSLGLFISACVVLAGIVVAFAVGAQQDELKLKLAWMGGSLLVSAIGVFVSIRINKAR